MKVLIVKMSALGDVVQALPVAMAIKRQAPEAVVDWLVESPSAGLLQGHPALRRVLVSPRHEIKGQGWDGLPAVGGFMGSLRAARYDAVVDLQGLMKSAIFVSLSRARRKIGFRGGKEPLASWPLNEKLPAYDPDRHALERYLDLLGPLGLERPAQPEFGLRPSEEEAAAARALLEGRDASRPLVVLHPVAKWHSKLWPLRHWVELARRLAGQGLTLAVTGSAADAEVGQAIVQGAPEAQVLDLTGRTGLRQLMALLGLARAVVSTDTGVMHLAAAVGAPVLALFGPTAPWRTGPWGQGHRVLRLDLACSPCFRRTCDNPRCLTELRPADVAGQALEMIETGARPAPSAGE